MSRHKSRGEETPREFPNPFTDYTDSDTQLTKEDGKLVYELSSPIRQHIARLLRRLETEYNESTIDYRDYTVYTGTSGVGLLYFHMHNKRDGVTGDTDNYLQTSISYVDGAIKQLRQRGVSFLCGDAGPLALGAVIYRQVSGFADNDKSARCLDRLLSMSKDVLTDCDVPDELLFGRCGYLFALLFVRQHLGDDAVPLATIKQLCVRILESGRALSHAQRCSSPLMYEWHDKKYLGAAHGLVGILHTLMMVNDPSLKSDLEGSVRPTLDYLMTLRFPSGNYPSSIGSSSGDLLVHWCHGAPGWIHMFALAYKASRAD